MDGSCILEWMSEGFERLCNGGFMACRRLGLEKGLSDRVPECSVPTDPFLLWSIVSGVSWCRSGKVHRKPGSVEFPRTAHLASLAGSPVSFHIPPTLGAFQPQASLSLSFSSTCVENENSVLGAAAGSEA